MTDMRQQLYTKNANEPSPCQSMEMAPITGMDRFRMRANKAQMEMFHGLGRRIGEHPKLFLLVPFMCGLLGLGLFMADVVVDLDEVWVAKGSRLDGERDFYSDSFGPRDRTLIYTFVARERGGNVLTTAALNDVISLDRRLLDTRPYTLQQQQQTGYSGPYCFSLAQAQCVGQMLYCSWNNASSVCEEADPYGVKPSFMNRNALTISHMGLQWGLRELCSESEMPPGVPFRAVCSTSMTPMHCFTEAVDSLNAGMLALQGWAGNHPVSYTDEAQRKKVLGDGDQCLSWTGSPLPKGYFMGGVTKDAAGEVTDVKAWASLYPLVHSEGLVRKYKYLMQHPSSGPLMLSLGYPKSLTNDQALEILEKWEEEQATTEDVTVYSTRVTWFSEWTLSEVIRDSALEDTELIIVGFIFMQMVVWAVTFDTDPVHSRLLLVGVGGVINVMVAVAGSLGLACLFQIPLVAMSLQVLPYVCMGTGIDDMFILLHYFDTSHDRPVPDRMAEAMSHAGPSVLATSSVNFCVYLLCALVPVNAVFYFAFQAAISVVLNFLCILLGFSALLALDAYRVQGNRFDLCCCVTRSHPHVNPKTGEEEKTGWEKMVANLPNKVESCFRPIVTQPVGQVVVMLVTLILLGVSIYGAMNPSKGLPASALVLSDNQAKDFLDDQELYLSTSIAYVVGRPAEWWSADLQARVNQVIGWDMVSKDNTRLTGTLKWLDPDFLPGPSSWMLNFRLYAYELGFAATGSDPTCFQPPAVDKTLIPATCCVDPDKYLELLGFWLGETGCHSAWCDPLMAMTVGSLPAQGSGAPYRDYIAVQTEPSPTGPKTVGIKYWRSPFLVATSVYGNQVDDSVEAVEEIRDLLDKTGLDVYGYGSTFSLHEQYIYSEDHLLLILALTLSATLVVLTIVTSSPVLGLIMVLVIAACQVTIVAMVNAYSLKLNGISLLSIVFGIALNVEQTVHLARVFLVAEGTRAERVAYCMREMTGAVVAGALTTFVAVLPLAWAKVQFYFDYFFVMYSSMVALCLFYALFPLPVMLCLFGPLPIPKGVSFAVKAQPNGTDEPRVPTFETAPLAAPMAAMNPLPPPQNPPIQNTNAVPIQPIQNERAVPLQPIQSTHPVPNQPTQDAQPPMSVQPLHTVHPAPIQSLVGSYEVYQPGGPRTPPGEVYTGDAYPLTANGAYSPPRDTMIHAEPFPFGQPMQSTVVPGHYSSSKMLSATTQNSFPPPRPRSQRTDVSSLHPTDPVFNKPLPPGGRVRLTHAVPGSGVKGHSIDLDSVWRHEPSTRI
eukprot:Hpha_TRINITY_DN15364_c4_g5::TRINITY_DN15364_c4_g5_i1::g.91269::m.91269